MPGARMLKMVVMKLIAPRIDAAPAMWSVKIAMSTAGPREPLVDSGASPVHPFPPPRPLPPGTNFYPTLLPTPPTFLHQYPFFILFHPLSFSFFISFFLLL